MSFSQVVIEGTLNPDGTLDLDQKPDLSPGRVRVTLQPASGDPQPQRGLADIIAEIRRDQESRGFSGLSAEEIEAGLREGDADYERKMQALCSQTGANQESNGS